MIEFTDVQLFNWVTGFMWPLTRILGLLASAPVLSHKSIPVTYRVALGVFIALIVAPGLPPFPEQDPLSWTGVLILIQQFLIGISIGFVMQLVFTGFELAGELMGMTMGLGFAAFFDPQTQGRSSVVSQFLLQLIGLLFLSHDLHLSLLEVLVHSFSTLPVEVHSLDRNVFKNIAFFGSHIFSIGVQIALPIVTALLFANLALGVLTRAAPQLNLFGIGFPITMTIGYLMLELILPYWTTPIFNLFETGFNMLSNLAK
jgi:flagellar biosynthetic protein FliR